MNRVDGQVGRGDGVAFADIVGGCLAGKSRHDHLGIAHRDLLALATRYAVLLAQFNDRCFQSIRNQKPASDVFAGSHGRSDAVLAAPVLGLAAAEQVSHDPLAGSVGVFLLPEGLETASGLGSGGNLDRWASCGLFLSDDFLALGDDVGNDLVGSLPGFDQLGNLARLAVGADNGIDLFDFVGE